MSKKETNFWNNEFPEFWGQDTRNGVRLQTIEGEHMLTDKIYFISPYSGLKLNRWICKRAREGDIGIFDWLFVIMASTIPGNTNMTTTTLIWLQISTFRLISLNFISAITLHKSREEEKHLKYQNSYLTVINCDATLKWKQGQ